MKAFLLPVLTCLLLTACEVQTFGQAQLSLSWQRPVERENGEQLFLYEIGGYEIVYRQSEEYSYRTLVIENGETTNATLAQLDPGTYEVRIAAFDSNGLYSQFSDPAYLTTP